MWIYAEIKIFWLGNLIVNKSNFDGFCIFVSTRVENEAKIEISAMISFPQLIRL